MRRVVWFVGGLATGAAGAGYAKRKVTTVANRMRPTTVAHSATARRREDELRAERDGRLVRLGDHLVEGDEVLVDGEIVEPGRVILLRRPDHSTRQ